MQSRRGGNIGRAGRRSWRGGRRHGLPGETGTGDRADLVAKAAANGYMVLLASPAEIAKFVKDESDKFAKLINASGAKGSD